MQFSLTSFRVKNITPWPPLCKHRDPWPLLCKHRDFAASHWCWQALTVSLPRPRLRFGGFFFLLLCLGFLLFLFGVFFFSKRNSCCPEFLIPPLLFLIADIIQRGSEIQDHHIPICQGFSSRLTKCSVLYC